MTRPTRSTGTPNDLAHERSIVSRGPNLDATWNELVTDLQRLLGEIGGMDSGAHFHAEIGKLFHAR